MAPDPDPKQDPKALATAIKPHVIACQRANDFLVRVQKFLETYNNSNLVEAQIRLDRMDEIYSSYQSNSTALEILISDQKAADVNIDIDDDLQKFEELFFTLKATLISHCSVKTERLPDPNPGAACGTIRLPSISLPEFHGEIEKWYSFYDTFRSLVHENTELSSIQKFHYLKASLKGKAAKLIDDVTLSSNNYPVALKVITDRFEHPKVLIKSHLNALFAIPKMHSESAQALSTLVDDFQKNLGVLRKLGEPTDGWSSLLVHMLTSRLDQTTKREWERNTDPKEMPTYEKLIDFLQNHILQLQSVEVDNHQRTSKPFTPKAAHATTCSSKPPCLACSGQHPVYYCDKFKRLSVPERTNLITNNGFCINCMVEKHSPNQCKQRNCRFCNKKHNSLLHTPKKSTQISTHQESNKQPQSSQEPNSSTSGTQSNPSSSNPSTSPQRLQSLVTSRSNRSPQAQVFLSTALVKVIGPKGNIAVARVLLDNASQPNLMTERFRRLLNLRKTPTNAELFGVGAERKSVTYSTVATVSSRFNSFRAALEFLVLPRVTTDLPTTSVDITDWSIPDHIKLADPTFSTSSPVDMVIGCEIFFDLLRRGHMRIDENKPLLQNSVFGWLVSGAYQGTSVTNQLVSYAITTESLEQQVARFWELESCSSDSIWSIEERLCEEIFVSTTRRDSTGRYVVTLPKHAELVGHLGDSRSIATRRFFAMERKLERDPDLRREYSAFMDEYIRLGHMELADAADDVPGEHFYLPHHAVLRPESTTTKLRVVFDGSCKSTSGFSLNDLLLKGPIVQDDMVSFLFRFRMKRIVIKADVAKMFRQMIVAEIDRPYLKVVWRTSPSEPLQTYQLTTVTYGTTTAPYLATRCLQQLSIDEAANFPAAAPVVKKGFYVDDLMSGFDTLEEAIEATNQLQGMMKSAGLTLRKWSSNSRELMREIPTELWETKQILDLDQSSPIQALGLLWEPASDEFLFKIPKFVENDRLTKRIVLSQTASLFDPLGLAGPVIVIAKLFIQGLWERNLDWDEQLPIDLHQIWSSFIQNFPYLQNLRIPRFVLTDEITSLEMHGFSDASLRAYGACVYFRAVSASGAVSVHLMAAKSRVAPSEKRRPSLARLELCAALLLANLQKKVLDSVEVKCTRFFWSDSTIVLHWLAAEPSSWKTFVANRVAEVQQLTQGASWNYVSTHDNPADHISRGLDPADLVTNQLWWQAPEWLRKPMQNWPESSTSWRSRPVLREHLEKREPPVVSHVIVHQDCWFETTFEGYDSFNKVLRVLGLCNRFIANCKRKSSNEARMSGPLSVGELRATEKQVVRQIQLVSFSEEFRQLSQGVQVNRRSPLRLLNPFIREDEQIVRVGGRLKNATIPYNRKHPMLLPKNHFLVELIFRETHELIMHAGPTHLLAAVRRKFWPIDGRNKARSITHTCITCFRYRPSVAEQIMGDLPAVRINQERVFRNVGIDYCGPFYTQGNRKQAPTKCYLCIFVCMPTKAAHIELVTNLTTEAFIGALKRFWARRGYPSNIYCDNATNFVGADRELQKMAQQFNTQQHKSSVAEVSSRLGIQFHFIPARSPSFGGLWEACVKSTKEILQKATMDVTLTHEEMLTTLAQVEACLNSRPLTPLSSDPQDLEPLTPGHFIIGGPIESFPEPDLQNIPCNRLSRWQRMQRVFQEFWSRWHKEYLPTLQKRYKWPGSKPNLAVGDMVLLKDDNQPPFKWSIARVIKTIPGADGNVRVADVLVGNNTTYRRSIHKLCPLPKCTSSGTAPPSTHHQPIDTPQASSSSSATPLAPKTSFVAVQMTPTTGNPIAAVATRERRTVPEFKMTSTAGNPMAAVATRDRRMVTRNGHPKTKSPLRGTSTYESTD